MTAYRFDLLVLHVGIAAAVTVAACADPVGQEETPKLDLLQVLPASGTITVGGTASLGAQRVVGPTATNLTSTVKWSSDNEAVASVSYTPDDGAVVLGVAPGVAHIKAVGDGAMATAEFKVIADVIAVELDKGIFEIAKGTSKKLGATLIASDASKRELRGGVWATTRADIASVDDTGIVTAVAVGDATISLIHDGISTSQLVHVRDWALESITAATADGTVLPPAQSTSIRVTGMFAGNHTQNIASLFKISVDMPKDAGGAMMDPPITLSGTTVTAGEKPGSASVSGTGKAGTAAAGKNFQITFTVVDVPLVALALTMPATVSTKGLTITPTITGTFGPEMLKFETGATLAADPTGIVYTDNASGTIMPLAAGLATITASVTIPDMDMDETNDKVIKATQDLTVVNDDISALTITLDSDAIQVGAPAALTATGAFGALDIEDLTDYVVWSSDNEAVAVVSNVTAGKVTGMSAGAATITAAYRRTSKTFPLTVK